ISCSYSPAKGPSFVEVTLHDGDLAAWKKRNGGKSPVAVPEFGADAFINPDFQDWADLYAKKGGLILRVTMPKGAQSIEAVKAIARKALARLTVRAAATAAAPEFGPRRRGLRFARGSTTTRSSPRDSIPASAMAPLES